MTLEQLLPKTELERAYAQARSWTAIHTWRRGTLDLRSGRMVAPLGIYLALVRAQALSGNLKELEQTLDCLYEYGDKLTAVDKQSVVRVLCNILSEVREDSELDSQVETLVDKRLVQSAVAFTAQIKGDKGALLDAIYTIKQSAELDLITTRLQRRQISELKAAVEDSKAKLIHLGILADVGLTPDEKKKINKARYILKTVFKKTRTSTWTNCCPGNAD